MNKEKFQDRYITLNGDKRGFIPFKKLDTLWFMTGTLCNLECVNCYIESSPTNDSLAFLRLNDVIPFLDEIKEHNLGTKRIGFTGGEPFLNPSFLDILENCLSRGFETLVLTNAFKVINKAPIMKKLLELREAYGDFLQIRVSLDHYTLAIHEDHRGVGKFNDTLKSIKKLAETGFKISIAGRASSDETLNTAISGYKDLLKNYDVPLKLNEENLVVFPEMDINKEVPEITEKCFTILNLKKESIMCSNERMVVKRKGESGPKVLACTLLTKSKEFELGETLVDSFKDIHLNHPYCASFCVLGGASCSST